MKIDIRRIGSMMVVCIAMKKAVDTIAEYTEEPPKEVVESIEFLKNAHDFFHMATVMLTENEDLINKIPPEIRSLWDVFEEEKE